MCVCVRVCVCVCVCVCVSDFVCVCVHDSTALHTSCAHPSPLTLPSAVQAANTVEAKGAHATSQTTLLRSKVNMGFLHGARGTDSYIAPGANLGGKWRLQ